MIALTDNGTTYANLDYWVNKFHAARDQSTLAVALLMRATPLKAVIKGVVVDLYSEEDIKQARRKVQSLLLR
jgi:hypothetical protein